MWWCECWVDMCGVSAVLGGYVWWCECWVDMCGGVSAGWICVVV